MIKKIGIAVAAILVALIVVVAVQPSDYHVERSIVIDASPEVAWSQISDFSNWNAWNPWQKMDPQQKVTNQGTPGEVGHSSSWKGEKTGEGTMTIRQANEPRQLAIDLEFKKPFESEADTDFVLKPGKNNVEVTWSMDGHNDFVGKFFGLVMGGMDSMIGKSYEQGLARLKQVTEKAQAQADKEKQSQTAASNGKNAQDKTRAIQPPAAP